MKAPIVYLYENEIRTLILSQEKCTNGVAFEWKDESVYHIHTITPRIPVSGMPCMSFLAKVPSSVYNSSQEEIVEYLEVKQHFGSEDFKKKAIVCVFLIADNKIQKKSFLIEGNSLLDCDTLYVPQKSELYSRSRGLLETGVLEQKKVAIVGLGSFGSNIAVELAKAGIGQFKLFDFDRIELSNIARHICGINDLGRYKTHAIRDAILLKNPFAEVTTFEININEYKNIFSKEIQECDLILCLSDETSSRAYVNDLVIQNRKKVIYGRAITRAEGGDVFRYLPQEGKPCLACLIGNGLFQYKQEEISNNRQLERDLPAYSSLEDHQETIQVGLSSDIIPICNMIVKLSLVELSKGLASGITFLEEDLTADYFIWANRRESKYKNWDQMGFKANQLSILRWYGVRVPRNTNCLSCGNGFNQL